MQCMCIYDHTVVNIAYDASVPHVHIKLGVKMRLSLFPCVYSKVTYTEKHYINKNYIYAVVFVFTVCILERNTFYKLAHTLCYNEANRLHLYEIAIVNLYRSRATEYYFSILIWNSKLFSYLKNMVPSSTAHTHIICSMFVAHII